MTEQDKVKYFKRAMRLLTPTQRRRWKKYNEKGKPLREIALEEGVTPQAVDHSLKQVEKRLKKRLFM